MISNKEQFAYTRYADLFVEKLQQMLHTKVLRVTEERCDIAEPNYAVSLCMDGDIHFVSGFIAEEPVFWELAHRYSEMPLTEMEDLAADSMMEFLNVLHGLFAIVLAEENVECDWQLARWAKNVVPHASSQQLVTVQTDCGVLQVVMAADEFI